MLDRVVEIIRIALVLILELVEKIEELEREGRRRAENRSGEPACAKELNLMRDWIGRTMTIANDDTVNSIQVEDHVVVGFGRVGTVVIWAMAKLNNLTEGGESRRLEEQAGPFLKSVVSGRGVVNKSERTLIEWSGLDS